MGAVEADRPVAGVECELAPEGVRTLRTSILHAISLVPELPSPHFYRHACGRGQRYGVLCYTVRRSGKRIRHFLHVGRVNESEFQMLQTHAFRSRQRRRILGLAPFRLDHARIARLRRQRDVCMGIVRQLAAAAHMTLRGYSVHRRKERDEVI